MKIAQVVTFWLSFVVCSPIWYFLVWTLLKTAHVDRLVWFLFWVYVVMGALVGVATCVIQTIKSVDARFEKEFS